MHMCQPVALPNGSTIFDSGLRIRADCACVANHRRYQPMRLLKILLSCQYRLGNFAWQPGRILCLTYPRQLTPPEPNECEWLTPSFARLEYHTADWPSTWPGRSTTASSCRYRLPTAPCVMPSSSAKVRTPGRLNRSCRTLQKLPR